MGKMAANGNRNRRVHQMERELRPVVQDDFFGGIAKANEVERNRASEDLPTCCSNCLTHSPTRRAEMVRLHNDFGKKGTAYDAEKPGEPPLYRENSSEGRQLPTSRWQGAEKVFSIQLFSFK